MMFAAGAFGASWLWLLALVVARYYGTWGREWWGWQEIKMDFATLVTSGSLGASTQSSIAASIAIGAMLGWFGAWATFLYALSR